MNNKMNLIFLFFFFPFWVICLEHGRIFLKSGNENLWLLIIVILLMLLQSWISAFLVEWILLWRWVGSVWFLFCSPWSKIFQPGMANIVIKAWFRIWKFWVLEGLGIWVMLGRNSWNDSGKLKNAVGGLLFMVIKHVHTFSMSHLL